jgi:DNA-binding GntR family transcriptional regulator
VAAAARDAQSTRSADRARAPRHERTALEVALEPHRARFVAGLPKYAVLRETLVAAIQAGVWKRGMKLPTEQAFARSLPYSLGTIQRALRALVEDGFVVRVQGQGTFVAEGRKALDAPWHCRFLDDAGSGFLPVYPHVVLRRRIAARGPWSACLQQRGDNIIRIDRALNVADEFVVYSRFYVNADRFGALMDKPLQELDAANFKAILDREFNLPVTHLSQTLETGPFPAAVCRAIGLAPGAVGTTLDIVAGAGRARNVYYQRLYIPPCRRRLVVSDALDARTSGSPA